jgi:hypothetical protein
MALPQPIGPLCRIAPESHLSAGWRGLILVRHKCEGKPAGQYAYAETSWNFTPSSAVVLVWLMKTIAAFIVGLLIATAAWAQIDKSEWYRVVAG